MQIKYQLDQIHEIARSILEAYPQQKCFAFFAEMGSGKTTLINALCKQLGVTENTSSPTFSIINEYRGQENKIIYHTDWYRLKGLQDAIEAGVQDILDNQEAYCFIEWPEIAASLLPVTCLHVKISYVDDCTRTLEI